MLRGVSPKQIVVVVIKREYTSDQIGNEVYGIYYKGQDPKDSECHFLIQMTPFHEAWMLLSC